MSRSSIALSNLRAVVIVIVVAFHSVLAYLASLPATAYRFDSPPYRWQAIPIVDSQRWFGFDLFCAWQDVSLMSLMFFLSGLFVPASLMRRGSWAYVSDRLLRIGLPFMLAVTVLMPLAYYPAYRVTAVDPGVGAFWQHWLALPFWPCGPQWFLWQLLALNVLATGLYRFAPAWRERLERLGVVARAHPIWAFAVLVMASTLAYVPLAMINSPWAWGNYGPFSLQLSRPLHYLVYFFAGYAIGSYGFDRGLLASNGPLARHWGAWLAVALAGFVLWALPTSASLGAWDAAPRILRVASSLGFAVGCAAGCFFLLAVCLRFAAKQVKALDSLSANAYAIYMVHYLFIVWLQFALLDAPLFAFVKAATVFGGTLLLSWALAAALGNASFVSQLVGAKRADARASTVL
jgi:glucan biosynthesis protein C